MDRDHCRFHRGGGGGLIFEGKCIFENKPLPQSRSCLLLKKGGGLFSGGYGTCKKDCIMLNANDTFNLGAFFVLIIGGRSEACDALDDCWLLKIEDYSLTKVICN